MKKYLFSIIFLLVSYIGFSQKGLSYQAVILDPNAIEVPGQDITGQPLVNGDVWMKFSIYNGSTLQFEEVQKTKTDAYGLVNLMIGSVSTASFNSLTWDGVQKSLQVFVSFNQGASYTKVSEQKLTYSPYTLFAETAGKLGGVLGITGGGTGATTVADARLNLGLDQVNNTSDAAKPVSTATNAALALKANTTDVNAAIALKANTTDMTSALAAKADTADVDAGLALKANTADMTAALAAKADTGTIKSFVVTQVAAATIADADASTKGKIQLAGDLAGTADAPTVPGLALKANTSDMTTALDLKANSADVTTALALKANANNVVTSLNLKENTTNKSTDVSIDGTSDIKYPSVKAVKTYVDAQVTGGLGAATISDADANTKGKIQLAGDLGGTAASPTVPGLGLKAPLASPTFTGTVTTNTINTGALSATSINTPIYASTPQELTDATTISWDPALGLNASVTLGGNRLLNFTTTPAAGSYGTLVVNQDGTGNRTITLPSINGVTNNILGSTSTSTVALSTAANAKDILNFYFDGSSCYWNIGQGYGSAASSAYQAPITLTTTGTGAATLSGTTLNIPTPLSGGGDTHTIGEAYGGGIVFYVTADGLHGLIAETVDQSTSSPWFDAQDIISTSSISTSHSPEGALFTDWRLPTRNELNLMYTNIGPDTPYGNISGFSLGGSTPAIYWSSTKAPFPSPGFAAYCVQNFSDGAQDFLPENNSAYVRAIRSF